MSFEDTIRVAQLKTRATRFERVREEIRAAPGQLFGITEFMKPRVTEIAGTLPARLGAWLLRSPRARGGLQRFTGGKQVRTGTVSGFLLLYALRGCGAGAAPPCASRRRTPASRRGWPAFAPWPHATTAWRSSWRGRNGSSRATAKRTSAAGAVSACSWSSLNGSRRAPTARSCSRDCRPRRWQTRRAKRWPARSPRSRPRRGRPEPSRGRPSRRDLRIWAYKD